MTQTPVGLAADPDYLSMIERAHRGRVGENFCYVAVEYPTSATLWRLAIVRKHEPGYYPISDDFWLGYRRETEVKADDLNRDRMGLSRREAARMIASSMCAANG